LDFKNLEKDGKSEEDHHQNIVYVNLNAADGKIVQTW